MRKHLALLALPIAILALVGTALGHGDEEHESEAKQASDIPDTTGMPADEQTRLQIFQIALDSVYDEINASYFTVEGMLKNSCYDCHSINPHYPWYYKIPGIKGWMQGHIDHGLKHVDFSNGFPFGGHGTQLETLDAIKDEVKDGDMPIFSYRLMHWGKLIEGSDQETLFAWIDDATAKIKETYEAFGVPLPKEHDEHGEHEEHEHGDDDDD